MTAARATHGLPLLRGRAATATRPYLAINMVASVDGRATLNGSAIGIGSALDKRLMYELRAEADVVLHGASTVRAHPLSARVPTDLIQRRLDLGLAEQALGAIVTRSGQLPAQHRYYTSPTVIYMLGHGPVGVSGPHVEVCRVQTLGAVIDDLQRRGARRIVCEGGPTLNATLLVADLVDELFLTIAPKLLGQTAPLTIVHGGDFGVLPLELRSQVVVDGELFLKYGLTHRPPER